MARGGEIGDVVVEGLCHRLEAGGLSVQPRGRGFETRPFGVRQRVWADVRSAGRAREWRVHVRTGFVRGYSGSPAQLGALSLEMALPALGGIVRAAEDPGRLEIASTLHVHAVNQVWATDFLARAARLQAAEAILLARASALVSAGAEADVDERDGTPIGVAQAWPVRGTLLDVLRAGPSPGVSHWDAGELTECAAMLAVVPHARWAATERGLTGSVSAEEPWLGGGPSVLEMAGGVESPGLGLGLRVRLTVPRAGGVEDALVLNEREAAPGSRTDLLGGWSADEGVLQHTAFFPNAVYARDIALHVALSSVLRAHWVRGWPPRTRVSLPLQH